MGTTRTQWHVLFYAALREHGSSSTEALAEVLLSKEPQQGDILLIRKREGPIAEARTLRRLWPLVQREALIEYKSPSRPPRPCDLAKLVGYGGQHHTQRCREIGAFHNLLLCLVVTSVTDGLRREVEALDAPVSAVAPGYHLVETRPYRLLVVDLSTVVEADEDEWMSVFVPSKMLTAQAARWLEEHMPSKEIPANSKLEGHDEVLERLLHGLPLQDIWRAAGKERLLQSLPPEERLAGLSPEERLAGLAPEQRLAGLAPEQRLAGLTPEQRLLAMPDSVLRELSDEYVRTLPEEVQAAIRRRVGPRD